jgi:hypothetical protein
MHGSTIGAWVWYCQRARRDGRPNFSLSSVGGNASLVPELSEVSLDGDFSSLDDALALLALVPLSGYDFPQRFLFSLELLAS